MVVLWIQQPSKALRPSCHNISFLLSSPSLTGSRSIHRWRSFRALSKGHNKRLHREALHSPTIQYTHKCTQQTYSYAVLFCFIFSLFFYVTISIFSLFSGLFWSCFWVRGSVGEMVGCPLWGRLKWCLKEFGLMLCRWTTSKTHAKSMLIWYFFWGARHTEQRSNWVTIYPYILVSHK